jgi:pimeloyl-ACP methyl ester carboxylesterase
MQRRFFDPESHRIVLFDQRGAGRSTPRTEVRENTTRHLIVDMERLRCRLGIERWLLFGGSWGSTLPLAYGQAHPECCLGFVLRGIFLTTAAEIDWFVSGMRTFCSEAWRAFADFLPADERHDLLGAYHRRLLNPDPAVHLPAARAWSVYECSCSTLLPNPEMVAAFTEERMALGLVRIEAHYFVNRGFSAMVASWRGSGGSPSACGDRAGPLRPGLPRRDCGCGRSGLARGRVRGGRRRRPFRPRARHSERPDRSDKAFQGPTPDRCGRSAGLRSNR